MLARWNASKILLGDKKVIINEVEKYMKTFKQQPYIFNLGHGILPQTNPEVLENIIKRLNLLMTDKHPKILYGKNRRPFNKPGNAK